MFYVNCACGHVTRILLIHHSAQGDFVAMGCDCSELEQDEMGVIDIGLSVCLAVGSWNCVVVRRDVKV